MCKNDIKTQMRIDKLSSERLNILHFPLIVGVIFIHAYATEWGISGGSVGVANSGYFSIFFRNLISQGIARIAVPLFFLMSGYFAFLGFSWSVENYKKKLNSRIKSLLIPFLFWNFFNLLFLGLAQSLPALQVYRSGKKALISTYGVYDFLNAIIGIDGPPISYQFWFIRDLIVMVLLIPIIHLALRIMPKILLGVVFTLWFLNLWPVYVPSVEAFAFFYVGAYLARSNTSLFALDRFGITILSSYLVMLLINTFTKGYEFNKYIHNADLILGIASALFLSKKVIKSDKIKRAMLWTANFSFFVFAVHEPLLTMITKISYKALKPSSDIIVLALYILIPALVIILSILLYIIMKSISPRFLKVISGGR